MKINTPQGGSSFGIPQDMKDAAEKRRQAQEKREAEQPRQEGFADTGFGENMDDDDEGPRTIDDAVAELEKKDEEKKPTDVLLGPIEALKELGIEPTEEDFHQFIFRGYLEKTIPMFKMPMSEKYFTAKVKTLTAEEMDMVDELSTAELEKTQMSRDGHNIRRSMWIMSFAILELQGKPIVAKPIMLEDKTPDYVAMAKERRKVLAKLSPYVIDSIINKHAQFSTAINMMVFHPEKTIVKK